MERIVALVALLFSVFILGCGKTDEPTPNTPTTPANPCKATQAKGPSTVSNIAKVPFPTDLAKTVVEGSVLLEGRAMYNDKRFKRKEINMAANPGCGAHQPLDESLVLGKGGGIQNAFVWVSKGLEKYEFSKPTESVKLDQFGCVYVPHVVGIQVGQILEIHNSDKNENHNVKTEKDSRGSAPGSVLKDVYDAPRDLTSYRCNVHPWMNAWVQVVEHPYFAVTDEKGRFALPEKLPPGKYTISVAHELEQDDKFDISAPDEIPIEIKEGDPSNGHAKFIYQGEAPDN